MLTILALATVIAGCGTSSSSTTASTTSSATKSTTASGSTKPSTGASGGAATETTIVATGGGSFCKNVAVKAAEASLATYVKQHCGIDVGSPTTSTP